MTPWPTTSPGLADWDPNKDVWELYNLETDYSQAEDLAAKEPQRLDYLKALFLEEAKQNQAFPIGAGIWLRLHPEDRIKSPYTSWVFDAPPPACRSSPPRVWAGKATTCPLTPNSARRPRGCSTPWAGASGGLTLFMDKGHLVYEYNMMIIERYQARTPRNWPPGKHKIEVTTTLTEKQPLSPAEVVLKVDGKEVARTTVKRTVPVALHRQRDLRRGRGPGLAGVPGLFRPGAVPLHREDWPGGGEAGLINASASGGSRTLVGVAVSRRNYAFQMQNYKLNLKK